MNAAALSSIPTHRPVALIDLVAAKAPEVDRAFVARNPELAERAGGRVMMANEAIAPMIIPDEAAAESDHAIRLLVITWYPTRRAGQLALDARKEWDTEFPRARVRTYAARPAGRIESSIGRTLPYTLGLLGRSTSCCTRSRSWWTARRSSWAR